MILAISKPPYNIGARRTGCRDGAGKWHENQAYVLLREVTVDDWCAFVKSVGKPATAAELRLFKNDRFFEVATD